MAESWIKLHTEILRDPKLNRLRRKVNDAYFIWISLLCICKEGALGDYIGISEDIPYEIDELAQIIGVEFDNFNNFIEIASSLDMLEIDNGFIFISHWNERQVSDNNERVKRYREKQKCNAPVTEMKRDCNASCNAPVTEMKRDCNASCNAPVTEMKRDCNASVTDRLDQIRSDKRREDQIRLEEKSEKKNQQPVDNSSEKIVIDETPYHLIMDDYNTYCMNLPRVKYLTPELKENIKYVYNEINKTPAVIHDIFLKLIDIPPFEGWQPSFSWLFKNKENWAKVLNGQYERGSPKNKIDAIQEALNEMEAEKHDANRNSKIIIDDCSFIPPRKYNVPGG